MFVLDVRERLQLDLRDAAAYERAGHALHNEFAAEFALERRPEHITDILARGVYRPQKYLGDPRCPLICVPREDKIRKPRDHRQRDRVYDQQGHDKSPAHVAFVGGGLHELNCITRQDGGQLFRADSAVEFHFQQPSLDVLPLGVSAYGAVGLDYPVAGQDYGDGVFGEGLPYRARCLGSADMLGEPFIGAGLAVGDVTKRQPYRALKLGGVIKREFNVKVIPRAAEVFREFAANALGGREALMRGRSMKLRPMSLPPSKVTQSGPEGYSSV